MIDETELPTHEENYPYGDGCVSEQFTDYECSCGGDFEEAEQCVNCGEWVLSEEAYGYYKFICKNCYDKLYSVDNVIQIAQQDETKLNVGINSLLTYAFSQKEIEDILWDRLYASLHSVEKIKCINEWADDDIDGVADELLNINLNMKGSKK